jgi:hypothetical protein
VKINLVFIFFICFIAAGQVKYTKPNNADNLRNLYDNDPSVRVWGGIRTNNENDVKQFADLFIESMFLWIYNNKLSSIQPILIMTQPTDPLFEVTVKFVSFDGERTIARAHSPIDINDSNDLNWKNIILVDFDKWVELNKHQKMWLMSHEIMHELFATSHGEGGELMYPTIPSLNNERLHSRIKGTSYNFLENDIELNNALEKVWNFIWENHCTKKGAFTIERASRQY